MQGKPISSQPSRYTFHRICVLKEKADPDRRPDIKKD